MNVFIALAALFLAGAAGGLGNAYTTDHGFRLPHFERLNGGKVWLPGFIGNMFIGGLGAVVLVSLNTSLGAIAVIAGPTPAPTFGLTVGNLVSAIGIGIAGAKVVTDTIEKRFEQATRTELVEAVTRDT